MNLDPYLLIAVALILGAIVVVYLLRPARPPATTLDAVTAIAEAIS
jgi:hypothetical protein